MPNPVGRPTKFTPETRDKILQALRSGNYRETACRYAGISFQTLRNWMLKAEEHDAPPEYVEFVEAIEKAEADAEVADLALIRRAAQDQRDEDGNVVARGSWQAAAWIRERKNPERWGRREATRVEVTGEGGGPIQMEVNHMVDVTAIEGLALSLDRRRRELEEADRDAGFASAEVVDVEVFGEDLL